MLAMCVCECGRLTPLKLKVWHTREASTIQPVTCYYAWEAKVINNSVFWVESSDPSETELKCSHEEQFGCGITKENHGHYEAISWTLAISLAHYSDEWKFLQFSKLCQSSGTFIVNN